MRRHGVAPVAATAHNRATAKWRTAVMPKAGVKYGPRIKGPDYEQIAKEAETVALTALGLRPERPEDLIVSARPDDLVVKAAEAVRQADAEIALYQGERDRALAHLWFYEQRLGLAKTVGLSPMGYRRNLAATVFGDKTHPLPDAETNEDLIRFAEEAGVERVQDAETKLLEAAPIVHAARARREVAVRVMQAAVLALSQPPYEWSPEQIAEHAGVSRTLAYQHRTAARKRYGL
ncbi:hypothetical protein GCM10010421_32110 [Streptomyces glaucus]|uniref:Uncharacterized protein n=2 Tax=Streptomyces glaucus TaxID=284029 RepID=A0ABP5WXH6_9ACTN